MSMGKRNPAEGRETQKQSKGAAGPPRVLRHGHMVCAHYSVMLVVLPYTAPLCLDILVTYLI